MEICQCLLKLRKFIKMTRTRFNLRKTPMIQNTGVLNTLTVVQVDGRINYFKGIKGGLVNKGGLLNQLEVRGG